MYTVRYVVGEIAQPPTLAPQVVWRRQITPTVGPFWASIQLYDYDTRFRAVHPEVGDVTTEVKTKLDRGDEFVVTREDGFTFTLTVGAPIPPGGNP